MLVVDIGGKKYLNPPMFFFLIFNFWFFSLPFPHCEWFCVVLVFRVPPQRYPSISCIYWNILVFSTLMLLAEHINFFRLWNPKLGLMWSIRFWFSWMHITEDVDQKSYHQVHKFKCSTKGKQCHYSKNE